MNTENAPSGSTNLPRCRHFTTKGRQCRLTVADVKSSLCFRHASLQSAQPDSVDLSPDFDGQLAEFKSASQINDFLAKLTILLVQNRVSPRRAAVLAYLNSLLLRSLREIYFENNPPAEKDLPTQIIFDTPRPIREDVPPPNPIPS